MSSRLMLAMAVLLLRQAEFWHKNDSNGHRVRTKRNLRCDAIQAKLNEQVISSRAGSEALMMGRIFDDRGHRMTPSYARKGAIKYRYYISAPLVKGQPKLAGTISRVPAEEIEV